jgi:hypothetical protein
MLDKRDEQFEPKRILKNGSHLVDELASTVPLSGKRTGKQSRSDDTMVAAGFLAGENLLARNDSEVGDAGAGGRQARERTQDSNTIRRDPQDRIIELTPDWSNQKDRKLKVDYAGDSDKPRKVTFADQGVLQKNKDRWELLDKDGAPTDSIPGLPKIDADKITDVAIDQKTGALTISLTDDSTVTKYPDGSAIVRNADGKPTKIFSSKDFFSNFGREIDVEYQNGKEKQIVVGDASGNIILQKQADGGWAGGRKDRQSGEMALFPSVKDVTVDRESGTVHVDLGRGYHVKAEGAQGKVVEGEVRKMTFSKDGTKRYDFYAGGSAVIGADGLARKVTDRPEVPAKAEIARGAETIAKTLKAYEKNPLGRTSTGAEVPVRTMTREQSADLEDAFKAAAAKGKDAIGELEAAANRRLKELGSPYQIHFSKEEPERGTYVYSLPVGDDGYRAVVKKRAP